MEQERERGFTIVWQAVSAEWKGYQVNIIDTRAYRFSQPKYTVFACIRCGVVIRCCPGCEPQAETFCRQADRFMGVPRTLLCEQNGPGWASFERTIQSPTGWRDPNPDAYPMV